MTDARLPDPASRSPLHCLGLRLRGIVIAAALLLCVASVVAQLRRGADRAAGESRAPAARVATRRVVVSGAAVAGRRASTGERAAAPVSDLAHGAVPAADPRCEPAAAAQEVPDADDEDGLESPEAVVRWIRGDYARGTLLDAHAEARLDQLGRWAVAEPDRTLAAIKAEMEPGLVEFLYRAFFAVRQDEGIAAIATDMIDVASRHPSPAHRAGALRYLTSVLWNYRERLEPGQQEALVACAASLDPREPAAVRGDAARLLVQCLDRPEVSAALVAFAARAAAPGDAEARAVVLQALAERGHPDALPLALREVQEGRTPEERAAAVAALLRLPRCVRAEHRAELVAAGLQVQSGEPDAALRVPALLALAVVDPERARPFVLQALAGQADGRLKSALEQLDGALAVGPAPAGGDEPEGGLEGLVQQTLHVISETGR